MRIWVDADACPGVIKDILYRAAERAQVLTTLVSNQALRTPPSPYIRALQVPAGFDVADDRIAAEAQAGDLVITADIPLSSGRYSSPRGIVPDGKMMCDWGVVIDGGRAAAIP